MSTSIAPIPHRPPSTPTLDAESRVVLLDIGWDDYETILRIVGDRRVRLTYVEGNLEIMSPSARHESYNRLIEQIVRQVALGFRMRCKGGGSTTFKRRLAARGVEPDACFFFGRAGQFRPEDFDP